MENVWRRETGCGALNAEKILRRGQLTRYTVQEDAVQNTGVRIAEG